jgi:exodeoxyribonuclease V gamma subunit
MQTQREPGDRSSREDDRQLFLETLFAARERLIVTYGGRSIRDDREVPPSTCLAELWDVLAGPPGRVAEERRRAIEVSHRLQGYSSAYFDGRDPRLFSYRTEYERAARNAAERSETRPFVPRLEPVPPPLVLSLEELLRFWKSPPAYLLNRRLGIYLKERRPELTTRELLEMSHLDEWQVATPLIAALLENEDEEAAREVVEARLRAQGKLPVGGWGRALLDDQLEVCAAIAREVREQRAGAEMRTVELDLALPGLPRLEGALADAYGGALVLHGYSSLRARHQLDLWIRHVALCAASPALPSRGSVRIGRKDASASAIVFSPLAREAATHELEKLVKLYLAGQHHANFPRPAASIVPNDTGLRYGSLWRCYRQPLRRSEDLLR